jgi:hypothetical protein
MKDQNTSRIVPMQDQEFIILKEEIKKSIIADLKTNAAGSFTLSGIDMHDYAMQKFNMKLAEIVQDNVKLEQLAQLFVDEHFDKGK